MQNLASSYYQEPNQTPSRKIHFPSQQDTELRPAQSWNPYIYGRRVKLFELNCIRVNLYELKCKEKISELNCIK